MTTNKFVARKGLIALDDSEISGSLSVSGSIYGEGSNITGVVSSSYAITASYAENAGGSGGIAWLVATSSLTASVDTGYLINSESVLSLYLPTSSSVGSVIRAVGVGSGGWEISQGGSQQVHFGILSTITGSAGSLASTHQRDAVEIVCVAENVEWQVISSVGSIEVT